MWLRAVHSFQRTPHSLTGSYLCPSSKPVAQSCWHALRFPGTHEMRQGTLRKSRVVCWTHLQLPLCHVQWHLHSTQRWGCRHVGGVIISTAVVTQANSQVSCLKRVEWLRSPRWWSYLCALYVLYDHTFHSHSQKVAWTPSIYLRCLKTAFSWLLFFQNQQDS